MRRAGMNNSHLLLTNANERKLIQTDSSCSRITAYSWVIEKSDKNAPVDFITDVFPTVRFSLFLSIFFFSFQFISFAMTVVDNNLTLISWIFFEPQGLALLGLFLEDLGLKRSRKADIYRALSEVSKGDKGWRWQRIEVIKDRDDNG